MILAVFPHMSVKNNSVQNRWVVQSLQHTTPVAVCYLVVPAKPIVRKRSWPFTLGLAGQCFITGSPGKKNKSKTNPVRFVVLAGFRGVISALWLISSWRGDTAESGDEGRGARANGYIVFPAHRSIRCK